MEAKAAVGKIAWIDPGCGIYPRMMRTSVLQGGHSRVKGGISSKSSIWPFGLFVFPKQLGFGLMVHPPRIFLARIRGENNIHGESIPSEKGRPGTRPEGCHYRSSCRERLADASQNWEKRLFTDPSLTFMVQGRCPGQKPGSWVPFRWITSCPSALSWNIPGSDNQKHRPVMIHRAPFGSLERFCSGAD